MRQELEQPGARPATEEVKGSDFASSEPERCHICGLSMKETDSIKVVNFRVHIECAYFFSP